MIKRILVLLSAPVWCCCTMGFLAILLVGILYYGVFTSAGLAMVIIGSILIGLSIFVFFASLCSLFFYPHLLKTETY